MTLKTWKKWITLGVTLVATAPGWSQFDGTFSTLYLMRYPNARAEAMGRVTVTQEGGSYAAMYNPALLATLHGLEASFSTSSRYYMLQKGRFTYLGGAFGWKQKLAIGFGSHTFDTGEPQVLTGPEGPEPLGEFTPKESRLTLSLAAIPWQGFHVGVNLNRNVLEVETSTSVLSVDVGVYNSMTLAKSANWRHRITLAASLLNLTKASLKFATLTSELPQILRIGGAYHLTGRGFARNPNVQDLALSLHAEWQDVLNSSTYSAVRFGGEMLLFEFVALRFGYFTQEQSGGESVNGTTYGLGFRVPLKRLTSNRFPVEIAFDWTRLTQPGFSDAIFFILEEASDKFSVVNVRAAIEL